MLSIDAPLVHLIHDIMLEQHGGRAGLRTSRRAVVVLVECAPVYGKRGGGRRVAAECAAYYLCAMLRDRPFRDQNETTAWALALYSLRFHGFEYTPAFGALPLQKIKSLRERPESASEEDVADWLYRGTQIAGAVAA